MQVNCRSVWARPHKSEATVKMATAEAKTVRAPRRSATQPEMGMKMARVRRYAVMPMFMRTAPMWKERAIWGRAVAMTVPSRFSMKKAPATRAVIFMEEGGLGIVLC